MTNGGGKLAAHKLDLLAWQFFGETYQRVADYYGFSVSGVWKAVHRWRRRPIARSAPC